MHDDDNLKIHFQLLHCIVLSFIMNNSLRYGITVAKLRSLWFTWS